MAAVAATVVVVLGGGVGYAWADAADVVPGVLTARPLPAVREAAPPVAVLAPAVPARMPEPATDSMSGAPAVDAAALAARLEPLLTDPALGPSLSVSVRDLATGELLYAREGAAPRTPASTAKLLTASAALETLGAGTRLVTSTSLLTAEQRGAARPAVVLTGGGDVLLAAGAGDSTAVVGRAGLADLADATARSLLDEQEQGGVLSGPDGGIDVVVDDSLLGAAQTLGRPPGDTRFAATPASLAVDSGRLGPDSTPRDADPAATAGVLFATALQAALTRLEPASAVVGDVVVRTEPQPVGPPLAQVESATVAEVLDHLLATSDNTTADALAGLVAAAQGRPTTLASAGQVVAGLAAATATAGGSASPVVLSDGSGLSRGSAVSADTLTAVLAVAATAPADDDRRFLAGLLPVAGVDGTLQERFEAVGEAAAARGVARPKTGTLTGVTSLAGVVPTAGGRGVSFALMADAVPAAGTGPARDAMDRALAAIATCC